jgi:hypothetical protein
MRPLLYSLAETTARRARPGRVAALAVLLALIFAAPVSSDEADALAAEVEEIPADILDMSPDKPAAWGPKYIAAPLVSIFRGAGYMYRPRELVVDTTPSGGYLDLFYVRSGFQKRFEQAEAPLTVILPSRLKAGPRDSLTIRAFAEGYRQESVTLKVSTSVDSVSIDLEPLPNMLNGVSHRYFAGRSSIGFLTKESLTFRLQEADDGFSVILTETAMTDDARESVESLRSPLIDEGYGQQLGEDLMVKVVLSEQGRGDRTEVRSRQSYNAPRDVYEFAIDLVPTDGGAGAVDAALAALADLGPDNVGGCALSFDDSLRRQLDPGSLARALSPQGSFTDPYVRAAMRRLGEVSVDGVVDFVDGSQYRPTEPIELEMSLSNAGAAKGFLALLDAFVTRLEASGESRSEALRSLVAPELPAAGFGEILQNARKAESGCSQTS